MRWWKFLIVRLTFTQKCRRLYKASQEMKTNPVSYLDNPMIRIQSIAWFQRTCPISIWPYRVQKRFWIRNFVWNEKHLPSLVHLAKSVSHASNRGRSVENSTGFISYDAILDTKILKHIQDEFGDCLQYACVSKPRRPDDPHRCTVYIHIILKRTMNKKTRFLHPIAGLKRIITEPFKNCMNMFVFS